MFKPGNSFADYIFTAITFLPLLPAMLILFQKNFGKESLNLLLIICLVNFIRDLPLHSYMLSEEDQCVINNVSYPLELVLLARLFRPALDKSIRDRLTIILVAFLSSLITWLSIKGWENNSPFLGMIQHSVLIGIILLSLPPLVRSGGLGIFRSTLFWIAGGTLFYLLTLLLLEWIAPALNTEEKILLSIASLVRYSMYIIAVVPGRNPVPAD
jgi:hypothetical protein